MAKKYGTDFTKGSIPKQLLLFSLPLMGANMLQVVYSMVDMMIVGRFVGSAGISAVNSGSQIVMFFTMMCIGFENGAQVYLSQIIGSGKREKLNSAIGTIFSMTIIMGVFAAVVCAIGAPTLLRLINTPPEAFDMAVDYLLITGGLIFFTFGYNVVSTLQRAQGDSRRPLIFIGIATVVNIVLDLLFTGYLGWGTRGAAWATIIGQIVSFAIAISFLYRNREHFGFDFKLRSLKIDRTVFSETIKLGGVTVVQFCMIYFSMIVVTSMVNKLGVAPSAMLGVGLKIDDLMTKMTLAFYVAGMVIIGQNFAAGDHERVKMAVRVTWVYCAVFYTIFAILYINFAQLLFGAFTDDPAVLGLAHNWIRASICGYLGIVVMRGTNALVQGIGFVKFAFVTSIADAFLMRVGFSFFLGTVLNIGLFGYCLGYLTACYATAIPGLIYYLSGRWKRRRLVIGE